MPNAIPTKTRQQVIERDENRCFRCGMTGTEIQHRKRRREGGHALSNLIRICSSCHRWVHANPARATEDGYTVSSYADPQDFPVTRWDGAKVLLHDDGQMTFVSA